MKVKLSMRQAADIKACLESEVAWDRAWLKTLAEARRPKKSLIRRIEKRVAKRIEEGRLIENELAHVRAKRLEAELRRGRRDRERTINT